MKERRPGIIPISIEITTELYNKIRQTAKQYHISKSAVIRLALVQFFKKQGVIISGQATE